MNFSNNREARSTDKIIYIDGSFDLLHTGHIERLKKAKAMGSYLYAGVWDDDVANTYVGHNYPLLSLHERVLMVLSNRYVDDVIIGAPYQITEDLIKSLNISKVVQSTVRHDEILEEYRDIDPYEVAKRMGIFEEFEIENTITLETIAQRVVINREKYMVKFSKKKAQQDKYYEEKTYVEEK